MLDHKDGDRREKLPLLFDMATDFQCNTEIYYFENDIEIPIKRGLVFEMTNSLPTLERTHLNQKKELLRNWINIDGIKVDGKEYNTSKIILEYSNKAGGAHYDPNDNEYFFKARSIKINGVSVLDSIITTVARITLEVGTRIIKSACSFEKQFLIAINSKQNIDGFGCIFEYCDSESYMGYKLLVDNQFRLHFIVINRDGLGLEVVTSRMIDWKEPRVLIITSEITSLLETEVTILIDGEEYGKQRNPLPIFSLVDIAYYHRYYNCDSTGQIKPIEFGFSEVAVYNRLLTIPEKANNIYYLLEKAQKNNFESSCFINGIIGKGSRGNTDIILSVPMISWSLEKLARGELP